MKLVFRTTPDRTINPINRIVSPLGSNNKISTISQLTFAGSIFDRIRTSGAPCGSCGGR